MRGYTSGSCLFLWLAAAGCVVGGGGDGGAPTDDPDGDVDGDPDGDPDSDQPIVPGGLAQCAVGPTFTLEQHAFADPHGRVFQPTSTRLGTLYNSYLDLETGDIVIERSVDGGQSWAVAGVVDEITVQQVSPLRAVLTPQGEVLLLHVAVEDEEAPDRIYRSTNGGASFELVHSFATGPYGTAAVIAANVSGDVIVGRIQRASGDPDRSFTFVKSDDFGATWAPGGAFKDGGQDTLVTSALVTSSGHLLFKGYRVTTETPGGFVSRSIDGGQTWGRVRSIDRPGAFVGEMREIASGVLASLEYSVDTSSASRSVELSRNGGETWTSIFADTAGDPGKLGAGFHGVEVTPDGQILIPASAPGEPFEFLLTSDLGESWTVRAATVEPFFAESTHITGSEAEWDLRFFAYEYDGANIVGSATATGACR